MAVPAAVSRTHGHACSELWRELCEIVNTKRLFVFRDLCHDPVKAVVTKECMFLVLELLPQGIVRTAFDGISQAAARLMLLPQHLYQLNKFSSPLEAGEQRLLLQFLVVVLDKAAVAAISTLLPLRNRLRVVIRRIRILLRDTPEPWTFNS
jgi:hypothetical protein